MEEPVAIVNYKAGNVFVTMTYYKDDVISITASMGDFTITIPRLKINKEGEGDSRKPP